MSKNIQDKDFKKKQKQMTDLNWDGDDGLEPEDPELTLTKEEEEKLKKKIEEMRKRDPFIYR